MTIPRNSEIEMNEGPDEQKTEEGKQNSHKFICDRLGDLTSKSGHRHRKHVHQSWICLWIRVRRSPFLKRKQYWTTQLGHTEQNIVAELLCFCQAPLLLNCRSLYFVSLLRKFWTIVGIHVPAMKMESILNLASFSAQKSKPAVRTELHFF